MQEIFKRKSQIIYEKLKENIMGGKYKPNQRIIISKIAKEFGTSEIPVRESIKNLEAEGLIQVIPYAGAVVKGFNLEALEKIYQVRTNLEGLATKIAAENIEEKDLALLEKIFDEMGKQVQDKRYEALGISNAQFHKTIYLISNNEYLCKYIFELWDMSFRTPGIFAFAPERAEQSHLEHKKILSALKNRDGILAEKLIVEQKEHSLNALRRTLEN